MRNFLDCFGYMDHRTKYFDKFAMSTVTCPGYRFSLAPALELQVHPVI